ncbi:MAG TPA: ABC transporter permease [Acidobacteriota bacterium]|nr:ABC transporter permease [Acidobacteriota bacterium]
MHKTWTDFRLALRHFFQSPLFTAITLLTLALGIGANSAIFSVINGVLLKPLPFEDPDRLVGVWHTAPGLGFEIANQSPATYFTYRDENRVFTDIGLWDNTSVTVTGLDQPERVSGIQVTDGTLPLLHIEPALGRTFNAQDDSPGSPRTVILSHGYWQRRFGGRQEVLGMTLTLNGDPYEVIGVLPADFRFLNFDADLLLTFQFDRSQVTMGNFSFQGVARLKDGMTVEQANQDVDRMIPMAVENFPGGISLNMLKEARFAALVRPFKEDAVGDIGSTLWILLGTVGLVLLIACANVANLLLVRAEGRQQELAIRMALGADRWSVARKFLVESLTLGLLGGLAGLALAYGGIRLLLFLEPGSLPRLREISIDPNVLLFTLGISLLAGVLFGLFPMVKYLRPGLVLALKESGRGGTVGKQRLRARNVLVVAQISLALVLLVGSGLMVRSFQALRLVEPGFSDPDTLQTFRITIPSAEVQDTVETTRMHQQILESVRSVGGVESVGLSTSVPMDGWDSNDAVFMEDFPTPPDTIPPIRRFKWISEGYHETLGSRLVAGRAITWNDIYNQRPVVMITEDLAREYWDDPAAALGRRIRSDLNQENWREIIGVVGSVHDDGVDQESVKIVYWPLLVANQWDEEILGRRSLVYAVRSPRTGTSGFMEELRQAVWTVNPDLPLARVRTQREWLDGSMARTEFTLIMLAIAAGAAILLGAVGIYGVISYAVGQRTQEIGVRMALGARQADVSRMVLRHGLILAATGVVLGLLAAFGLTRLMTAVLFGVNPADPLTYVLVALTLTLIVLAATYLPARRASRLDPTQALRWE